MNNQILYCNPGELATIVFETLNSSGIRTDGYTAPQVVRIIFPNLSLASGYPQSMTKLDTGLYYIKFTLPALASAVGTYIADITYYDPVSGTGTLKDTFVQIVVSAPYGQYSITTA